jgi:hypothetical protein
VCGAGSCVAGSVAAAGRFGSVKNGHFQAKTGPKMLGQGQKSIENRLEAEKNDY